MILYSTLLLVLMDSSGNREEEKPLIVKNASPETFPHPDTLCCQLVVCQKTRVIITWFERLIRSRSMFQKLSMTYSTEKAGMIVFPETHWLDLPEPFNPPQK